MESLPMIIGDDDDDCVNSADGTIAERTWGVNIMHEWLQNLLAYYRLFNSLSYNTTSYYNYLHVCTLYTLYVCDHNLESWTIWMYSGVSS